jgi:hypothetical protein
VMLRLLRFKVDTREFGRNIGVGNIQFDKSLVVCKVIIVPVILLLLGVEKFKGFALSSCLWCLPQLLVILMTLLDMGRGVIKWVFLTTPVLMLNTMCALAIASETREYARECVKAHGVGYSRVVVGFNVGSKGGLVVFCEIDFMAENNFAGGVFVGYPGGCWEAINPKDSKVDKMDDDLTG